jgi:hypothetical protein
MDKLASDGRTDDMDFGDIIGTHLRHKRRIRNLRLGPTRWPQGDDVPHQECQHDQPPKTLLAYELLTVVLVRFVRLRRHDTSPLPCP